MNISPFWWALAGIILMISELILPGLILFFFGIGALLTALLSWILPLSPNLQIIVFIIASLAALFGLRRFLKPVFTGRTSAQAASDDDPGALTGSSGKVVDAIAPGQNGRILLNGARWKAESADTLPEGTPVEVIGQNNLTLTVKRKG